MPTNVVARSFTPVEQVKLVENHKKLGKEGRKAIRPIIKIYRKKANEWIVAQEILRSK
jgi:hypothetical protein